MEFIFPSVIVIYIRPTLDFHKTVNVKKWRYWNVRKPEFFFSGSLQLLRRWHRY